MFPKTSFQSFLKYCCLMVKSIERDHKWWLNMIDTEGMLPLYERPLIIWWQVVKAGAPDSSNRQVPWLILDCFLLQILTWNPGGNSWVRGEANLYHYTLPSRELSIRFNLGSFSLSKLMYTSLKFNSSPLKNDGWKTIRLPIGFRYLFRSYVMLNFRGVIQKIHVWYIYLHEKP